ncbi:MAG TPA: type IV pilus assembly protein PilM [Tepidisphaeraceae bacterium]|nr:type IV pilus assembly protein PilM [Tepidisphaeraceae bacterium]
MANPRAAWGIDIGNRALKAIKLVRDSNDQLKVEDFDVIEHETLLSAAGDNRDSLIQSALASFVQRHPERRSFVGVSVSGSASLARFVKLPPVEAKKVNEIVRFEAIQQIPFPLEDVEWTHQLFKSPDSPDLEVGIFAMRKELINHHLKAFTDVGLNVEVVQLNPLAVYNAMRYDQRLEGATMIIDLGAENTDLIIADGETIWLRSIPLGGKNFTEVLVKQFKLPFPKAEELKRTAATSKYAKQIFQAMRPVFADLVNELQRSIGFYASVHRESRLKRVIALGGTFRLPGLQKYLQQNLALDVLRIDRLESGAPADAKRRAVFDDNLLSLASAYGLAVQAMGRSTIVSSLLPAAIRREKKWKDKTPWFAASAASFLLGTGVAMGFYFLQKFQYDQNIGARQHIQTVIGDATTLDNNWSQNVEQNGAGDRQRIANVQGMVWARDLWPGLLAEIYGALPRPKNAALLGGDPNQIKNVDRKDRDILLIDSISSVYDTDLSKSYVPLAAPTGADQAQQQQPQSNGVALPNLPPIPAGSHGFRLTMELVTPYGGDVVDALQWVKNGFLKNLQALKASEAAAGRSYSLIYADVTTFQSAGSNQDYLNRLRTRLTSWQAASALGTSAQGQSGGGYTPPPMQNYSPPQPQYQPGGPPPMGRGPGYMGGGPPAMMGNYGAPSPGNTVTTPDNTGLYNDPLTGEDMTHDTLIEVTALVVVNPPH